MEKAAGFIAAILLTGRILQKATKETKIGIFTQKLFATFVSFCLKI